MIFSKALAVLYLYMTVPHHKKPSPFICYVKLSKALKNYEYFVRNFRNFSFGKFNVACRSGLFSKILFSCFEMFNYFVRFITCLMTLLLFMIPISNFTALLFITKNRFSFVKKNFFYKRRGCRDGWEVGGVRFIL